ncbi:Lysozyme [Mycena sanguinolenta]|uniref:Lysozyme n=1 Tax=Mycena sanguinolenta TaxID=230812 RepID=A0A8H6X9M1_9AGAR|nr:Lysozyme [Mycena sanguinolenta]
MIPSSIIVLLASFTTATWAAVNGPCSSGPGICISTSSCSAGGGVSTSGLCPSDPEDIKCCTKAPCASVSLGGGRCQFTSTCTGNHYTLPGLCPGAMERSRVHWARGFPFAEQG